MFHSRGESTPHLVGPLDPNLAEEWDAHNGTGQEGMSRRQLASQLDQGLATVQAEMQELSQRLTPSQQHILGSTTRLGNGEESLREQEISRLQEEIVRLQQKPTVIEVDAPRERKI